MKKQTTQKSRIIQIGLPLVIILGITVIVRGGYAAGQWLYALLH